MPKCPTCGKDTEVVLKEWDYATFHVKNLRCDWCLSNFRAYYKRGKFSHIIDNSFWNKVTFIKNYLKKKGSACPEEISKAMGLNITDTLKILNFLERIGTVEKLPNNEK